MRCRLNFSPAVYLRFLENLPMFELSEAEPSRTPRTGNDTRNKDGRCRRPVRFLTKRQMCLTWTTVFSADGGCLRGRFHRRRYVSSVVSAHLRFSAAPTVPRFRYLGRPSSSSTSARLQEVSSSLLFYADVASR